MREILFRGKRVDNGEWVEGDLVQSYKAECFIVTNGNYGREVCPETVGQFTGLHDKNGKRVFEGDVLKDDWGKVYEVIFVTETCGFMVECKVAPSEYETGRYRIGNAWCNTIKVVGTIHDNPELLKGE